MRLRLFERLGRLVAWRPGRPGAGRGRPGDSRADGPDAGGRHRRNAGAGTGQPSPQAGGPRSRSSAPAMQPPAGPGEAAPGGPPGAAAAGRPAPEPLDLWGRGSGPPAVAEELLAD